METEAELTARLERNRQRGPKPNFVITGQDPNFSRSEIEQMANRLGLERASQACKGVTRICLTPDDQSTCGSILTYCKSRGIEIMTFTQLRHRYRLWLLIKNYSWADDPRADLRFYNAGDYMGGGF